MIKSILYAAASTGCLWANVGLAADITVGPHWTDPNPNGGVVYITGDIQLEDADRFDAITSRLTSALVVLKSEGGNSLASMAIGAKIFAKRWNTEAYDICAIGCAAIWLAGGQRFATPRARIGFHDAYNAETGKPVVPHTAQLGRFGGFPNSAPYKCPY
jgi:hypothetical protein